jgi:hypothetical protein
LEGEVRLRQRKNYVAVKDVQIMFRKEESASDMGPKANHT